MCYQGINYSVIIYGYYVTNYVMKLKIMLLIMLLHWAKYVTTNVLLQQKCVTAGVTIATKTCYQCN
jgi:hypothetical protein